MLYLISIILFLTVVAQALTVRFFLNRESAQFADWRTREEEWRTREKRLTDELLRYAHVPALEVKQERVIKIPDPEVNPMLNDIDLSFYLDDLLEDLQQFHNLGHGMTPADAQSLFPQEWSEVKRNYDNARKPMRAA